MRESFGLFVYQKRCFPGIDASKTEERAKT